ncbi:endonuclease/exonuclease/phosphatase family protein [Streptomyces sp. A3M-1-3]|nr:endonuclease/exonuclease/phosphatase family protein [Streptomyces sp. A3M-1-3]MCP3819389.1 endonuclease/exonuclease/phosphatase family protein [Streptomyces sp. A3M-1-3]
MAARSAAVLLAGVSVLIGFRAADADGVTPVPQLLAFLPWLFAPAGLGLLLAAAARRRTGLVWALVALAAIGWFVRPYGADATEAHGRVVAHLRVLTANVEFGGAAEGLVDTVRREKPDLVFVQECDYTCSGALESRIPRKDYPYREVVEAGGAEGSAILSVHPLRAAAGVPGVLAMPGAVAEIGGRSVHLQLAHPLPPIPGGVAMWRSELGALRSYAAGVKGRPALLAGDFNASQDHAAFRALLDAGGLHDSARLAGRSRTPSWPADSALMPGTQIDHVLVSGDFRARSARFLDLANTDHRTLLVEVDLYDMGRNGRP